MTPTWTWLWAAAFGLPLATAVVLWLVRHDPSTQRVLDTMVRFAALTVLPGAVLAVVGPRAGAVEAPWLLLGTHLELDPVGRSLLLVTALLYGAALNAAWRSGTERRATLSAFLLLSFVGNAGVFVAADAVTFYLCFSVMGLAAYGLVIHQRTELAGRAGRIYIVLTLISEMAVLVAVMLTVYAGGRMLDDAPAAVAASDSRDLIVGLFILGFGIKAGLFPLHTWLPLAHPAAPPPGSAVLSGTMIKAGLVGWLRFLPLGEVALVGWGTLVVGLSLIGAMLAVVPGVLQKDPKIPLAYSSISQMGFLGVLVGTALAAPQLAQPCILAAAVYAVHHAMAKGGLFLAITVWRMHATRWMRWGLLTGILLLALAVAGAPFGSGAVAKYASKDALGDSTFLWFSLESVLPLVGTVTTILVGRAVWLVVTGPSEEAWGVDSSVLSWAVLIVGGAAFTWYLAGQWTPVVSVPGLTTTTLWDATWPILLGLAVLAVGWLLAERNWLPDESAVPAGDLAVPQERAAARAVALWQRSSVAATRTDSAALLRLSRLRLRLPAHGWVRTETRVADWIGFGVALAVVAAATAVVVIVVVTT